MVNSLKNVGQEIKFIGPKVTENNDFCLQAGIVHCLKQCMPKFIYGIIGLGYSVIVYLKLMHALITHNPGFLYEIYKRCQPAVRWIKNHFKLELLPAVNATIYDERSKYDGLSIYYLVKWSERYASKNAGIFLLVIDALAKRFEQELEDFDKIHTTPNGIDRNQFSHILDTVSAKKSIDEKVKRLGVDSRITLIGIVDNENITKYSAAFDAALLQDVVAYASPLKLFEYMALDRKIDAPNTNNIRKILTDEYGVLLTKKTAETINYTIRKLSDNYADREKKRHNSDNFSWDNIAAGQLTLFHNLLNEVKG